MSPERFRQCLEILNWTPHSISEHLGWSDRTGGYWASGMMRIPPNVGRWLEIRAKHALRYPPPMREGKAPKVVTLRPAHWTDDLSVRAQTALAAAGCSTVTQARALGYDFFIRQPYVGRKTSNEIGAAIGGWV